MHEATIAQNIIKTINEELFSRHLSNIEVKEVVFKFGKMNAILPDSLSFFFDVIKKEYPSLKDCKLNSVEIPITVYCSSCQKSYQIDGPFYICFSCQQAVSIKTGNEMFVDTFSIKD